MWIVSKFRAIPCTPVCAGTRKLHSWKNLFHYQLFMWGNRKKPVTSLALFRHCFPYHLALLRRICTMNRVQTIFHRDSEFAMLSSRALLQKRIATVTIIYHIFHAVGDCCLYCSRGRWDVAKFVGNYFGSAAPRNRNDWKLVGPKEKKWDQNLWHVWNTAIKYEIIINK